MIAQLRSESYKLVTTRTNAAIAAALVGLTTLAVMLHAIALPLNQLTTEAQQRGILTDVGINLGILFAGLLGALAITAEFRTGTIRPTLLLTPRRSRVIAAKSLTAILAGAVTGLIAAAAASASAALGFAIRGVVFEATGGDIFRLLTGAALGGALWAVIGLGIGALTRSQVPTVVGLFAWLLFVENLLAGDWPSGHRFVPGSLAQSLAGSTRDGVLASAALAVMLLMAYSAASALLGLVATLRRDVD